MEAYLRGVSKQSREFADRFGAGDWGALAGLLHDVGKACDAFQRRLSGDGRPVDHSSAGGRLALDQFGNSPDRLGKQKGRLLAYCLLGHHAGLPDGQSNDPSCLQTRFQKAKVPALPDWLERAEPPQTFPYKPAAGRLGFQCAVLCQTNSNVQGLVVEAALEQRPETALHALSLDPLAAAICTLDQIRSMFDAMRRSQDCWLEDWMRIE